MFRVFLPATKYISEQGKFFVGCRPTNGRLYPHLIPNECIFFYPEFCPDIDLNLPIRDHLAALSENCKRAAAEIKTAPPGEATAPIVLDKKAKQAHRHPLAVPGLTI